MSIFTATSTQALSIRSIFDALVNSHITEANIVVEKKGFVIKAVDPGQLLVIDVLIEKPSFQNYKVNEEETIIGINVASLQRVLKMCSNKDTLTFEILQSEPIFLRITIFNDFSKLEIVHRIRILNIDFEKIEIPFSSHDLVVSLPISDLSRHVKDFSHLSSTLELEVNQYNMMIRSKSDLCLSECLISPKNNIKGEATGNGATSIGLGRNGNRTVKQSFNIKYLQSIMKSNNLDNQTTLYFTQGLPLVIRFNVSIIGSIRFILAPEIEDEEEDEMEIENVLNARETNQETNIFDIRELTSGEDPTSGGEEEEVCEVQKKEILKPPKASGEKEKRTIEEKKTKRTFTRMSADTMSADTMSADTMSADTMSAPKKKKREGKGERKKNQNQSLKCMISKMKNKNDENCKK